MIILSFIVMYIKYMYKWVIILQLKMISVPHSYQRALKTLKEMIQSIPFFFWFSIHMN